MKLLSSLLLTLLGFAAFTFSAPAGSADLAEAAEVVTTVPTFWEYHLNNLRSQEPPSGSLLRKANIRDLDDLQTTATATWADSPELLSKLDMVGIHHHSPIFMGQTRSGRLVFQAPSIHGSTMNIPSPFSIHAEQLVAVNHDPRSSQGMVHRIGWFDKIPGFGPRDEYTNIAVKVGDKYLLADNVPLNRLAWTNTEVEVGGTPGDE